MKIHYRVFILDDGGALREPSRSYFQPRYDSHELAVKDIERAIQVGWTNFIVWPVYGWH
jgi:hypothetical protein